MFSGDVRAEQQHLGGLGGWVTAAGTASLPTPATSQRDALSLGNSMKVLEQGQVFPKVGFVLDLNVKKPN